MTVRAKLAAYAALLAMAAATPVPSAGNDDGIVSITANARADSVTVGQRFHVDYEFVYADSLRMLSPRPVELEKTRVLSLDWSEIPGAGLTTRRGAMTAMTLDLDGAAIPGLPFEFVTPGGDTVRALAPEVFVPVAMIAADTADLAPLKDQWEAPRSIRGWLAAGAALLGLAALAVWWWRRRQREVVEPPAPVLPADYVAMTELTRIERLGLIERGEFKEYYTLVVDAVRHYLEARYAARGIDAMDRTTDEVLDQLAGAGVNAGPLEPLLREADLVKFAKHRPTADDGHKAMRSARQVVTTTTPRDTPAADEGPREAAG